MLHNVLQQSNSSQGLVIEPNLAEQLFQSLAEHIETIENQGKPSCAGRLSFYQAMWLSKVVRNRIRDLTVLSYNEIPDDQPIKVVATVENKNQNERK